MKFGVRILPKPEVLDTQGRAVAHTLESQGYGVSECRVGKFVIVDVKEENKNEAMETVKKMAHETLCNPLTEYFEVEAL